MKVIKFYCRGILKVLNIKVQINNKLDIINQNTSFFMVSNHLSYIDVLILFAYHPSCFITSKEVKEIPFLGQITTLAGCIFVERRSRNKLDQEIKEIEHTLNKNLNIFIFPEATSTNGSSIRRFKRPLFNAAINTSTPVLPLTINYKSINNKVIDQKNRDKIFWYDDMTFFPHFMRLIYLKSIDVQVIHSKVIQSNGHDKTSLSIKANEAIVKNFIPIQ